jgi:hypothetical protein
MLPLL